MTGLSLLKNIRTQLLLNEKLKTLIDTKVFPVVAENGTTFPFVLLKKSGINGVYSKSGIHQDYVVLTVEVVDNNYSKCVEIAEEIRKTIEGKRFENIIDVQLTNGNDNFVADTYVVQMIFNVRTNNN